MKGAMATRDPFASMWADACQMLDRAERLQRQFARPGVKVNRGASWEPPIDVYETEHEFAIVVALPGVEPRRVEVRIEADTLVVTGTRTLPALTESMRIHRLEIPHGRFERRVRLDSGRLELVRREVDNGCLLLVFAKRG
jgi:HSP20 family molecular chaperone IbpA